jgi:hypothetical protein
MPFYYVIVASLSVRTLVILSQEAAGALPRWILEHEFASLGLVENRLGTLTQNGFLAARGERYSLTPKGRRLAAIFAWFKQFWRLGPGG